MGTADELALDVLINALACFSREQLGIKQVRQWVRSGVATGPRPPAVAARCLRRSAAARPPSLLLTLPCMSPPFKPAVPLRWPTALIWWRKQGLAAARR